MSAGLKESPRAAVLLEHPPSGDCFPICLAVGSSLQCQVSHGAPEGISFEHHARPAPNPPRTPMLSSLPTGCGRSPAKQRAARRPPLDGWRRVTSPSKSRFVLYVQLDANDKNHLETRGADSKKSLGGDWMRLLSPAGQRKWPLSSANDSTNPAMGVRGDSWRASTSHNQWH